MRRIDCSLVLGKLESDFNIYDGGDQPYYSLLLLLLLFVWQSHKRALPF
jgi:hypothetical protein